MSIKPKIYRYKTLPRLAARLRDDLTNCDFVLLYAYNGTGKTRLSTEFKNRGKRGDERDTLYFNAFTEDLFTWNNDLENDTERLLLLNKQSRFFDGLAALEMDNRIRPFLQRYVDFDFVIDYEAGCVNFKRNVPYNDRGAIKEKEVDRIKVSRGEENIFIWCFFLAVAQLAADAEEGSPYLWVKYFYIDDPISSLDENNAIAVATDLARLVKGARGKIKTVISSHHTLFFNVMCNELKQLDHCRYFLHKTSTADYTLRATDDTPFYHHVATLSELKTVMESGRIQTYHFAVLRSILEKTSAFFGFNDFGRCIHGFDEEDKTLFDRALNLMSHGNHSVFAPVEMVDDNKKLFTRILTAFLDQYRFELPTILTASTPASNGSK